MLPSVVTRSFRSRTGRADPLRKRPCLVSVPWDLCLGSAMSSLRSIEDLIDLTPKKAVARQLDAFKVFSRRQRALEPFEVELEAVREKKKHLRRQVQQRVEQEREENRHYQQHYCISPTFHGNAASNQSLASPRSAPTRGVSEAGGTVWSPSSRFQAPGLQKWRPKKPSRPRSIGPTPFRRQLSTSSETAANTSKYMAQHQENRAATWRERTAFNHGSHKWRNLGQELDLVSQGLDSELATIQQQIIHAEAACKEARGIECVYRDNHLALMRARALTLQQLWPMKKNTRFMESLGYGLLHAPHPQLQRLAPAILALEKELVHDYLVLHWIYSMRISQIYLPRDWCFRKETESSRKLCTMVAADNVALWTSIDGLIGVPIGPGCRRLRPELCRHHQHVSKFAVLPIVAVDYLCRVLVRQSYTSGSQAVYNALAYQIWLLQRHSKRLISCLDSWVRKISIKRIYPLVRKHQNQLCARVATLASDMTEVDELFLRGNFLTVFSRRLDFLADTEMQAREEAAQRLWNNQWKSWVKSQDKVDAFFAQARKFREDRTELRNRLNKEARKAKEAKKSSRKDRDHNDDDSRAWYNSKGKGKRDKKQGKVRYK